MPALLIFVLGISLSVLLHAIVRSWQRDRTDMEFVMRAQSESAVFRRTMERILDAFRGLRPIRGTDDTHHGGAGIKFIDAADFNAYVAKPLAHQPGIHAVGWVPSLKASERAIYVGAARLDYPNFQINELTIGGERNRAQRRPEHFPVHHLVNYQGAPVPLGLDLATDPAHAEALRTARITGQTLVRVTSEIPGQGPVGTCMEVIQPIYEWPVPAETDRTREPLGFVLALFSVDRLISETMAVLDDPSVSFSLYRDTVADEHRFYSADDDQVEYAEALAGQEPLRWSTSLNVGGQEWIMEFHPSGRHFREAMLWSPWQILAAGFFISLLLAAHLLDMGHRRAQVERLVVARTQELSETNKELQKEVIERRKAEDQLHIISRAVEQSANMIIITDVDGLIEYVNPRFTEVTGYAAEEVAGRKPSLWATDKTPAAEKERLAEALRTHAEWQGEFHNRCKDGRIIRTAATVSPIRSDQGEITHFLSVQVDLTEQRKLEEQFRQAQKMEIMGRMVGGVAHDFNNILTTILGFSQIFLRKLENDHWMRAGLQEIAEAAGRASNLTRQLLTFARKREPRQAKTNIDLNLVVRNMEKLLRRAIGEDVELVTLLEQDLGAVRADPSQLEQVLMNLAVNARDAMPDGGKLVIRTRLVDLAAQDLRGQSQLRPGPAVMLSVADTGCGMNDEVKEYAFEPFFTTKQPGEGTGLGLSTVYGIVQQSDGVIEIQSEAGQGTDFRIYFPQSQPAADPQPEKTMGEPPRGTETILVVEDDLAVRRTTVALLRDLGYAVYEAGHGLQALDICRQRDGQIDLLLLDVVMPRMSGPALVHELRNLSLEYKLIYTSGFTEHPSLKTVADLGTVPFIEKPFTRERLGHMVRQVLDAVA